MSGCVSALWNDHIGNEEAAAEAACYGTAEKNGHTREVANECDDGSVGCPDCPWVGAEECTETPVSEAITQQELDSFPDICLTEDQRYAVITAADGDIRIADLVTSNIYMMTLMGGQNDK